MCTQAGLNPRKPPGVIRLGVRTDARLSSFIPTRRRRDSAALRVAILPLPKDTVVIDGGLMCILPELDLILGAPPPGRSVRFTAPPLPVAPLLNKQQRNNLVWSRSSSPFIFFILVCLSQRGSDQGPPPPPSRLAPRLWWSSQPPHWSCEEAEVETLSSEAKAF